MAPPHGSAARQALAAPAAPTAPEKISAVWRSSAARPSSPSASRRRFSMACRASWAPTSKPVGSVLSTGSSPTCTNSGRPLSRWGQSGGTGPPAVRGVTKNDVQTVTGTKCESRPLSCPTPCFFLCGQLCQWIETIAPAHDYCLLVRSERSLPAVFFQFFHNHQIAMPCQHAKKKSTPVSICSRE